MHELVPDAKLIYLVRDPIERIVSHWVQRRADGDATPLERYVGEYDRRDNPIVCPSRYGPRSSNICRSTIARSC